MVKRLGNGWLKFTSHDQREHSQVTDPGSIKARDDIKANIKYQS
jgi:hypothetical protein